MAARESSVHEGAITVRGAVPGDEDAIAVLCAELDEFYGAATVGTREERAAQVRAALFADPPMARALLAWDGPALAGFAAYSFLWPAVGLTGSLYLKELYVASGRRREGIGGLLMDRLFAVAAEKGCSRIEWTTDDGNRHAQAFYAELGARPLTTKVFYRLQPPA